nr:immunoglobulin heavy chain junction region [Mus musculus]MBK4195103.1 immunoglobulin heavy chain junction region [Mus musculus]
CAREQTGPLYFDYW